MRAPPKTSKILESSHSNFVNKSRTTSEALHMVFHDADRCRSFFLFFQKAEEFYIKGSWAKDTEWIGPIYGG